MDDQKSVRDMVEKIFFHLGYELKCASDGAEAVELYKKAKETGITFDVVILDLTVPGGMGGAEAIHKLNLKVDVLLVEFIYPQIDWFNFVFSLISLRIFVASCKKG